MGMSIENVVKLNNGQQVESLDSFRGVPVHAIAGIGNPKRFFGALRRKGLDVIEHPFPDHYRFTEHDIAFDDTLDILMTEKDAVKCRRFANKRTWFVPAETKMDERFSVRLDRELKKRIGEVHNT
jgi:tetraacyldisaccharide 4'-kinase